jgi:hypothetical protein
MPNILGLLIPLEFDAPLVTSLGVTVQILNACTEYLDLC